MLAHSKVVKVLVMGVELPIVAAHEFELVAG